MNIISKNKSMLSQKEIFVTNSKNTEIKFSYEIIFNEKNHIAIEDLKKMFLMSPKIDDLENIAFVFTGETVKCSLDKEIIELLREDGDKEEDFFATLHKVCIFHENLEAWFCFMGNEFKQSVKPTGKIFPSLECGALYKFNSKELISILVDEFCPAEISNAEKL